MRKFFSLIMLAVVAAVGFTACNDDDNTVLGRYWISYGTMDIADDSYVIVTDGGARLYVTSLLVNVNELKDNDRVLVNYTLLSEISNAEQESYRVRLNDYTVILSKDPVLQSEIDEDEENGGDENGETLDEKLGDDPIRVLKAAFGGNYLNINFTVKTMPNTKREPHFINLVADDTEDGEYINLYLRHNGYEDVPGTSFNGFVDGFGRVSFNLTDLVPEGETSIKVRLNWTEYGSTVDMRVPKYEMGTFTLRSTNSGGSGLNSSMSDTDYSYDAIPIEVD